MANYLLKPAGVQASVAVRIERGSASGQYSIRVGDQSFHAHVERDASDCGWLSINGRSLPFYSVRKDDSLQIWIAGSIHLIEVQDRTAQRATGRVTAARRDDLPAPMPGTILTINVKPNDRFEGHAPLIVMESMKMEMTLSAPHAGRVKEIKCRPGQLVEMGAVLITFADEPNAATS